MDLTAEDKREIEAFAKRRAERTRRQREEYARKHSVKHGIVIERLDERVSGCHCDCA